MRVGIYGAGGRLGRHLAEILRAAGHEVHAWARPDADVTRPDEVLAVARAARPEAIANAASLTDVDRSEIEPAAAWRTNSLGAAHVAEAAAEVGALLVHVSTDYVFDGERADGAYAEDDAVRPLGMYARSKLAGEEAARLLCPRAAVVRVAWIYGGGGHRPDFVSWVVARARRGEEIPVVADQWGCPAYTADVGAWLASRLDGLPPGTYHAVGPEATTRLEMARFILETAGLEGRLRPVDRASLFVRAPRPRRLVLSIEKARAHGYAPRPWRDGVRDTLRRLGAAG